MSFISNFLGKKVPLFGSFEDILHAAYNGLAENKGTKDILAILKQGLNLIDKSTADDIEHMNTIASLLSRPRFREIGVAVKLWERIVELELLNFSALKCLVCFYIQLGRNKDAHQKGELLLKTDHIKGIAKDKEIVRSMGSSAKEFDVENPEKDTSNIYGLLGCFYSDHKDYALAISAFNISLEINPTNTDALNNIAGTFFRKKEYPEALKYYKRCLELTPRDFQKIMEKCMEKYKIDPINAEGIQAKAKTKQEIREAESEILFNIGECLFMLNKMDEARDALRKSIEKSGEYPHRNLVEVAEEILVELRKKYG